VLAYAPADSVAYTELRLDLPGSQSAELAKVMRAFPGFDDQAAFPVKLSELLDRLVGEASDGKVSWSRDIDPWFGGQMSVSVGPIPPDADRESMRAVALLSVDDGSKAKAWLDGIAAGEGATLATETYNGATITTVTPAGGAQAVETGYAVVGPVLAIGDVTSLKATIDTDGRSGLAADAGFKEAAATLTGDRLAFVWADLDAIGAAAESLAGDATGEPMPSLPAFMDDLQVPWMVGAMRAQDGAFVIETRTPNVDAIGPSRAAESRLPGLVPPTTVMLAEGHDVGATLAELRDLLAAEPELAEAVKEVDDALALVGGFDAATGWIGEAGIAVTRHGDEIAGGLVVVPTSPADAGRLMTQLKGFVQLGGAEMGLTVTEETYGDATINVVDLSSLGGLAGSMTDGELPIPSEIKVAWSVTDEVVVLSYGTDFVKAVLDARTGDSLAKTERFSGALAQAGAAHAWLLWVDVAAVREAIEAMAPTEMLGEDYASDVRPYLEAFDSIVSVSVPGETIDKGTVIIRVTGD
jgi:hypothetical protein